MNEQNGLLSSGKNRTADRFLVNDAAEKANK